MKQALITVVATLATVMICHAAEEADSAGATRQVLQHKLERVPDRGFEYIAGKPLVPERWDDVSQRWDQLIDRYDSSYQKYNEATRKFENSYSDWLRKEERSDSSDSGRIFEQSHGRPPQFSHKEWLAQFEPILREVRGTDKEPNLYESFRRILLSKRLFDELAEHYLRIVRESPTHFLVGEKLWADHAFYSKAHGDEILHRLQKILEAPGDNPQAPAIHLILGKRAKDKGDVKTARAHLQEVIRTFPKNVDWLGTGLTRIAEGLLNEMDNLNIGQLAPDFEVTTLQGKRISLAELRGKVVLLDFWATWCGPCVREVPMLKKLHEQLAEQDFVLISVSSDDDPNAFEKFVNEHQMVWPQIREGQPDDGEISRNYNVEHWPLKYLIDRQGRIVAKDLGPDELKKRVVELVSQ